MSSISEAGISNARRRPAPSNLGGRSQASRSVALRMRSLGIGHPRHDDQVRDKQLIVGGRAAEPSDRIAQADLTSTSPDKSLHANNAVG